MEQMLTVQNEHFERIPVQIQASCKDQELWSSQLKTFLQEYLMKSFGEYTWTDALLDIWIHDLQMIHTCFLQIIAFLQKWSKKRTVSSQEIAVAYRILFGYCGKNLLQNHNTVEPIFPLRFMRQGFLLFHPQTIRIADETVLEWNQLFTQIVQWMIQTILKSRDTLLFDVSDWDSFWNQSDTLDWQWTLCRLGKSVSSFGYTDKYELTVKRLECIHSLVTILALYLECKVIHENIMVDILHCPLLLETIPKHSDHSSEIPFTFQIMQEFIQTYQDQMSNKIITFRYSREALKRLYQDCLSFFSSLEEDTSSGP